MAIDYNKLANEIQKALGFGGKASEQTIGLARAIMDEVKKGVVSHKKVDGTTAAGSPLQGGTAKDGVISGMAGQSLANLMVKYKVSPKVTPEITDMAGAITKYLAESKIFFPPGTITGTCTSTAESPGILQNGAGKGGKITGITGNGLAAAMGKKRGVTPEIKKVATAIVDHLLKNAEAAYKAGAVTGAAPSSSGPLSGGMAKGGKVS